MNSITFHAEIAPTDTALQFGDAARIEIWSKPTAIDLAAAMGLLGYRQQNLSVRVYVNGDQDATCEFRANIAQLQSALRFAQDRAKIKFDVSETEILQASRLIGLRGRLLRLEIAAEGQLPPKVKREPAAKKEKGEFGFFWRTLFSHPSKFQESDMLMGVLQVHAPSQVKDALRAEFCPEDPKRSLSFVSPSDFIEWLQSFGLASLVAVARRAEADWLKSQPKESAV